MLGHRVKLRRKGRLGPGREPETEEEARREAAERAARLAKERFDRAAARGGADRAEAGAKCGAVVS